MFITPEYSGTQEGDIKMALQIKGKFIEASTLDGKRLLLKVDGNSEGGSLRFQKAADGAILELVTYDETNSQVVFKDALGNEEVYMFQSDLFEADSGSGDALRLKVGILPSDVMLESEFIVDESGTKVVKEASIAATITRDSEILEASGADQGKFKTSLMPSDVMLESEFLTSGLIKDEKIAASLTRDSEIMDGQGKFLTSKLPALAITSVSVVSSIADRDALDAQEGDIAVVNITDEPTRSYIKDSTGAWQELITPGLVNSVNGQTGAVTLSTSQITEGTNLYYTSTRFDDAFAAKSTSNLAEGTNQYFTAARAKSAAVVNSSAGSETDQAMSVSAGKAYADSKVIVSTSVDDKTQAAEDRDTVAPSIKGMKDWVHANARVLSVNGSEGEVLLDADDILEAAENPVNLYFTNDRARAAITGGASSIAASNLTASRALASDATGKVVVSAVTDIELGHLSGVTSQVQGQIDLKAAKTAVVAAVNALHVKEAVVTIGASVPASLALTAGNVPAADSMMVSVGRLLLQEDEDYVVEETSAGSGSYQIRFINSVAANGDEALEEGDKVFIKYMKELVLL